MFTGIITDIGIVDDIIPLEKGLKLKIRTIYDISSIEIGSSIACNGICLTVIGKAHSAIFLEAWAEALSLTTINEWQKGDEINLEKSLRIGDEIGGHLISGHVDAKAQIIDEEKIGGSIRFFIKFPDELKIFIAQKGSIALDGTSLTVNSVNDNIFDVLIINHTLNVTNWKKKKVGDILNMEIDQLSRYCVRYAQIQQKDVSYER